jgi:serine/threonine-protein kinase HipA
MVTDRNGLPGLLVERFDRIRDADDWVHLPWRTPPRSWASPAAKYNVAAEDAMLALTAACRAPCLRCGTCT